MNCANCQTEVEILNEKEYYCPKCDCTYSVEKGKKVRPQPTNRISQIEETVSGLKDTLGKVIDIIKPKDAGEIDNDFFWGNKKKDDTQK